MPNKKILKFNIDTSVYPKEAVLGASYVYVDRVYIYLDALSEGKISVSLTPKEGTPPKEIEKIKGEFLNELLHYAHRINIAKTNKRIRERIVEKALYSSIEEGIDPLPDDSIDPEDIAVPWEQNSL